MFAYLPAARRATAGLVLGVGIFALAGCASSSEPRTSYYQPVQPPAHVAGPKAVDLEADGREAQAPPPRRNAVEPDDPREPFSPNYGAQPRRQADVLPAVAPASQVRLAERAGMGPRTP